MEDKGNNVINNYKGVMLCSRPNEVNVAQSEKPFCARVVPSDQIGLVPYAKKSPQKQEKKRKSTFLDRHKRWLADLGNTQHQKKDATQVQKYIEEERFKKVKEQAEVDRERSKKMRNQYNQTASNVLDILDNKKPSRPVELTAENLRKFNEENEKEKGHDQQFKKKKKGKHEKPIWAQTQEEIQNKEEKEVDQLLNFFDNTQVADYSEDEQVQSILKNLKQKIETMKKAEDWKENEAKRMRQVQENRANRDDNDREDDKYSNFSVQSDGKSMASERSQKRIEELRDKKNQAQDDWDKNTVTSKQSANIEDKIAKNLADEVLRNYPNLRGVHSNTSIRKLLQAEAAKAIYEPIHRPVITTIVREKLTIDTSNLPYLHRNPAV